MQREDVDVFEGYRTRVGCQVGRCCSLNSRLVPVAVSLVPAQWPLCVGRGR